MFANNKKNILITGGAGYIGSSLARGLEDKFNIFILDDLSNGKTYNISKKWKLFRGSILNSKILKKIFSNHKISIIIHAAAKISVSESEKKKKEYFKVNFLGTKLLANEAKRHKYLRHFIFSSSAAVYGNPKVLPIDEKHIRKPINYYGKTKLMAENFLISYFYKSKNKLSILRYFNVSGIIDSFQSGISNNKNPNIISKICINKLKNKKTYLYFKKDKSMTFPERDFIHIKDLIKIYKYIIFRKKQKKIILNCCSSKNISVMKIMKIIEKKLKTKINYGFKKIPKNECFKILGSRPKFLKKLNSYQSMIESTVEWYFK
tara:strand:+ start:532 stop:1488 length:957 start_codon:yes stop_codon:yes gene_type:complete